MTSLLGMSSIRDLSRSGLLGFDGYSQADQNKTQANTKAKYKSRRYQGPKSQKPRHPTFLSPFVPCGAFPGNYMTEP